MNFKKIITINYNQHLVKHKLDFHKRNHKDIENGH